MSVALLAAKLALGPVLLPQAQWLKRTALRLPEPVGPRKGQVGKGEPALRVLVVGDSSAAGVGVADQAQALALPLARCLSAQLGKPVAWQLVAQTGVNTADARILVAQADLRPADVVVTALGVNDVSSQTSAPRLIEQTALLWQGLGYCPLKWASDPAALASDGFHPGPDLYPQWAQRLTQQIVQWQGPR